MQSYSLEKRIWSDADFEEMGWHDATLWSMVANPETFEFLLDLDYIFKWVDPEPGETYYKFWVASVTMVFENVHSVNINIDSTHGSIEVSDLHRERPCPTPNGKLTQHTYRFECQEGEITLMATGFKMIVRTQPVLQQQQSFSLEARNGVSFSRIAAAF